jgi:hypothetical protein
MTKYLALSSKAYNCTCVLRVVTAVPAAKS